MFDIVDSVLERAARARAGDVEVYAERSTSRRIKVFGGEVEELTAAHRKGLGVRVFRDGAIGYAYTSDTSPAALDDVVGRAAAHAAVSDRDRFAGLPAAAGPVAEVALYDERLATTEDAAKIDLALGVERAALDHDKRVKLVEDTVYADADDEVFLASSGGVRGTYRANSCYVFAYAIAEQDDQVETGYSYAVGRNPLALDGARCGREAAQRACDLLGAVKCPSMKATVVLDPFVAAAVIGVISAALTADAVQKGRSLFATLEGRRVADPLMHLSDDGLHPDGLASAPFDGEGTPSRRTPLVEGGVLQGFLYDTYTGRKAGKASTGNGLRGSYQSVPAVRPTNLVVAGRATPAEELIAGVERGVLITNAVGVHSGANPVSGEFSVGITGLLIESGRLGQPVHEVTLAGDIITMLEHVVALGDNARWVPSGSVFTPSLAIEGMSIGGL
jgi:PmbA protein